ncbi:MAG: two-component regulator propeller domain-containing protein [Bacteroidia bacterium]
MKCFFVLVQFVFCTKCFPQPVNTPALKFEQITSEQGLSNRNVLCMMVDHKGFLWIGTQDGVNRFDGNEFKIFRNNPFDTTTICRQWSVAMAEDKTGTIWIACNIPQGLNAYNPVSGKFKRYCDNPYYKNVLPNSTINFIYADEKNNLWISTNGEGLLKFNPSTNNHSYYKHNVNNVNAIHSDVPTKIYRADNNHLYIGVEGGFDIFDMLTGKCRYVNVVSKNALSKDDSYSNIFKDSKNNLWICTHDGLKMFDPATEKIYEYKHDVQNPNSIYTDTLWGICESFDGRLWITTATNADATDGKGLIVFDPVSKMFPHYRHDDSNLNSIPSDYCSEICVDKSGKIWIQIPYAIATINTLPYKFESFKHDIKSKSSLIDDNIQYIFQDSHGKIFVLIYLNKGIDVFNSEKGTFECYQPDEKVNKYFRESRTDCMFEDRHGNYWVEADMNKLIMYNPVSHHAEVFSYKENHHPDSLGVGYIFDVYEDAKENIWIGGENGLSVYNPQTQKFKTMLVDPSKPATDINMVCRFIDWGDGKIWMTTANGLAYYDEKKKVIIIKKFSGSNIARIASNSGYTSVLAEEKNKLWLGTMGQGLFLMDVETGNCIGFNTTDGLPNDVVRGILKDKNNNLWLATNNGICRFSPSKEFLNFSDKSSKGIFRNYNIGDGIPVKEFGWNCYRKMNDGSMLFAMYAASGLVRFFPDNLHDNNFIPPVYITHFSLFNKEVTPSDTNSFLNTTIETTKEINLSYHENVFSFGFAALNFVHPENNKYAYKLEGFDKDWIYTDATKRFANYTNINPGEYTFKVKGSNNDGVWNETPATIKLIITPPYWQTWWFRVLIAAAAAAAAFAFYRFRVNQLLRLQNIRNKIAHDLHDDIGSTLNSISVFSQVAQQEPEKHKEALDMIGESSRKVIDAMSDIVWTINPEHDSFEEIILRMRSLTFNLLRAKNIEHTFRADESLNEIKLSIENRRNFYLFFKETVNNLVKHADATRAEIHLTYDSKTIVLMIRDNGKGFDTSVEYNGNGINSMRNRAKEMYAKLSIESSAGNGTMIRLVLSV